MYEFSLLLGLYVLLGVLFVLLFVCLGLLRFGCCVAVRGYGVGVLFLIVCCLLWMLWLFCFGCWIVVCVCLSLSCDC